MSIFGKSISEYIAFEKVFLILTLVVGILRLGLSLGGVPDSGAKWVSITAVGFIAIIYFGIRVPTNGFGTYRHLLPLIFIQNLLQQLIICTGIAISIFTAKDNIFSAPEYSPSPALGRTWTHIAGHLTAGLIIGSILAWLIAMLIMFITSKVTGTSSKASAARA
ncbi:MAG TPA: hypothetical protein VFC63_25550 [Blastocatellia bacterium]|nr:hypothetical protein [Blastocatellia bacterium]